MSYLFLLYGHDEATAISFRKWNVFFYEKEIFIFSPSFFLFLKEPEYQKVRGGTLGRSGGGSNRHPQQHLLQQEFESQESDNLASTDSEVKKILTLHMPISEYDTLGSDSEGEKHHQNCSPIHHHQQHPYHHHPHQLPPPNSAAAAALAVQQAAAMAAAARQHQQFLVQQQTNGGAGGGPVNPMQIQHEMVTFRQRQRSGK